MQQLQYFLLLLKMSFGHASMRDVPNIQPPFFVSQQLASDCTFSINNCPADGLNCIQQNITEP